jgi:hypothetical protein
MASAMGRSQELVLAAEKVAVDSMAMTTQPSRAGVQMKAKRRQAGSSRVWLK